MEDDRMSQEQLENTALALIQERGDQLDDTAREELKNSIVDEISDAVDNAIVDALPEDCLAEMSALAEQDDPSEEEFDRIMAKANINRAELVSKTIADYRQKFLGKE